MSFVDRAAEIGGEPIFFVEVDFDICSNVYGVAPCTAGGAAGTECYQTFATCQDRTNYAKTTRTVRFVPMGIRLPAGLVGIPALVSVDVAPSAITPGQGLGPRASVTIQLQDQAHNDRGFDPYVLTRPYVPEEQGTLFGKLKARSPFYLGRPVRVYEGFLTEPFDVANFRVREYIFEAFEGPDRPGRVVFKAKDILKKADGDRAVCPRPSAIQLEVALDADDTTVQVGAGQAAEIVDTRIRIGKELIQLGTLAGDTWTGCTRGVGGSPAEAHNAGVAVQECWTRVGVNVVDLVEELITDFASIDSSWIPAAQWAEEQAGDLVDNNLTVCISEPTGVDVLLSELSEENSFDLVVDEIEHEIRLVTSTPWKEGVVLLNDDEHFLADTVRAKDRNDLRLSRVWVHYAMRNQAGDKTDPNNFELLDIRIATDEESANEYAEAKTKKIFSRFFVEGNESQVTLLTGRQIGRFRQTPVELEFDLDAQHVDDARTGVVIEALTDQVQGTDGARVATRFQITKNDTREPGSRYSYTALGYQGIPPQELVISDDVRNVNVDDELSNPPEAVNLQLTIEDDVIVGGGPALTDSGITAGSTVVFENLGSVLGDGGDGGAGGYTVVGYDAENHTWIVDDYGDASPGSAGEDAIQISVPWTIDNSGGEIFGGGGGGGGGAGGAKGSKARGGGGGGGGRGSVPSSGAAGGATGGSAGADGGMAGPGAGGDGGGPGGGGAGNDSEGGTGGAGGDWGEAGAGGGAASEVDFETEAGAGGAAGYAIRVLTGGSVTFTGGNNPDQVKGTVGA